MTEETLLHRQIHPTWIQNDVVSSQAFIEEKSIASLSFTPSSKDENKLSVYNGDKFSAEDSYNHYVANFQSAGVLSVSMKEVHSIEQLTAYEDNDPFDGHSVIDYTNVSNPTQIKKKAKKIKNIAIQRGWTHKK